MNYTQLRVIVNESIRFLMRARFEDQMNYRKNEDGSYTAFKYIRRDGSLLEATAADLDNAKRMLKQEIDAHKVYTLEEVSTFFSPGCPDQKGVVYCREGLVDIIKKDQENK